VNNLVDLTDLHDSLMVLLDNAPSAPSALLEMYPTDPTKFREESEHYRKYMGVVVSLAQLIAYLENSLSKVGMLE